MTFIFTRFFNTLYIHYSSSMSNIMTKSFKKPTVLKSVIPDRGVSKQASNYSCFTAIYFFFEKQEITEAATLSPQEQEEQNNRKIELERGYAYVKFPIPPFYSTLKLSLTTPNRYLRKFKTLSRAFATGDFRIIPNNHYDNPDKNVPGPWQKVKHIPAFLLSHFLSPSTHSSVHRFHPVTNQHLLKHAENVHLF
jgi:hypothetical protein